MQNINLAEITNQFQFIVAILIILAGFLAGFLAYINKTNANSKAINLNLLTTEELILFYKKSLETLESKIEKKEGEITELKNEITKLTKINLSFEFELKRRGFEKEIKEIKKEYESVK